MVVPAVIANSFRAAVAENMAAGSTKNEQRVVKVDVTLNNASWGEAQKLVKIVQDAIDNTSTLDALART
jgi:hypothetical protein